MAFGNLEDMVRKYREEQEKRLPGSLPENFEAALPDSVSQEFASRMPAAPESNYDVHVSDTTVPMAGKIEMPEEFTPATPEEMNPKPKWELENDMAPAPVEPTPSPVATKSSAAETSKAAEDAILSTDNDKAIRDAGLADLEKRRGRNKFTEFGAGIGDAISASASAFGGNAPGGFQQRLTERHDKEQETGKKDIETKLRNDANSDISKQYQALVGQFLQKDPKDPTILGLTANQIAEKIPAIEKIASMRQQEEMKRLQIENTKAIKDATASEKESRLSDELWTPMGQAKTKNDAKILKDAFMGYEGTKTNLDDLIRMRGEKGAEVMDRKAVNQAKTIAADLTVQYKDLAKLGVLSKDDYRLLERLIPSDPLQFDIMAHTPAALEQARKLLDTRMEAFSRGYGVISPIKAKGDSPVSSATPSASNGQRKTKAGYSYSIEG